MEGQKAAIFYDDGSAISRKDGTIEKEDQSWIFLKLDNDKVIAISRERIIRIEFKTESDSHEARA